MTDKAISPLRQRLIDDMAIRRLGPKTQHEYIRRVKGRATGFPCLVITTSSPAATRSSRFERCVFASKAPTVIILPVPLD